MAISAAVAVAAASTAYTVDRSIQAKREASQQADRMNIEASNAEKRAGEQKQQAQDQAAMIAMRRRQMQTAGVNSGAAGGYQAANQPPATLLGGGPGKTLLGT
jgi:copper oxidase (laccase) domain-containing protein